MTPAWIRPRLNSDGSKSYQVLYRRGGRYHRIFTAGSFRGWPSGRRNGKPAAALTKAEQDAKLRRDLVAGWLAQGLDPREELAKLATTPATTRTYEQWASAYQESRIDIDDETRKNIRSHLSRLLPIFRGTDPRQQTVADQIEAVAELASHLKPSSVAKYWATHRMILDFAGVDPNPARDKQVKLPAVIEQEPAPPPAAHVLAMLDKSPRQRRLPLVTIEQTGMAISETCSLSWGDVDIAGCQFRLRRSTVKARIRSRARWVQVPEWLMEIILESCPPDDRAPGRRLFPGLTPDIAKNVMARACAAAGIPLYSPHDLRHRRLSLWHGQGIPVKEIAARAGHSRASMTLDVYSHVMPLDEVPEDAFRALLVMPR